MAREKEKHTIRVNCLYSLWEPGFKFGYRDTDPVRKILGDYGSATLSYKTCNIKNSIIFYVLDQNRGNF